MDDDELEVFTFTQAVHGRPLEHFSSLVSDMVSLKSLSQDLLEFSLVDIEDMRQPFALPLLLPYGQCQKLTV
jgi:hypothetical protein